MDEDRVPEILYGEAANLQNEPSEYVLKVSITSATWVTDDHVEFDDGSGTVFLNDDQLLFRCTSKIDHSVAIDAECILLHAQSEDQVMYLQLHENPSNSDQGEIMEFTLTTECIDDCERLFRALSHLVEQHPVYSDDDNYLDSHNHDSNHDGTTAMMSANEYGEDMIVAAVDGANVVHSNEQNLREPSEEARNAMLDRLDAMLVVSPEISLQEEVDLNGDGQFDDADDDAIL